MNEIHEMIDMMLGDKDVVKCHMTHIKDVKLKGGKKFYLHGRVTMITTDSVVTICRRYTQYHDLMKQELISQGHSESEYQTPGERRWGKHVGDSCFIEHNDELYLQLIIDQIGNREYLVDNRPATDEEIVDIEHMKYVTPVSSNPQPLKLAAMRADNIITLSVIEETS